ncbi:hypothetical protein HNP99_003561 [Flavobacterium sp. 28A]|uniref:hypothetical protein n=1 Tax=Flavobacterium sp. 28A TaxID=2735895 RepID=UPI001E108A71|nr:hypothetical protein [Flavobacterium sp. 28A]NRT17182.1 hypothetical protein [Flavobacterium sp. 28A]
MRHLKILILLLLSLSLQAQNYCVNFTDFVNDFSDSKFPIELKKLLKESDADYLTAWNHLKRGGIDFEARTNPELLKKLRVDLDNTKYGLQEIFEADAEEILIWKQLKDDPFYNGELIKETTDPKLLKWKDREFFKAVTKKGDDFEIAMLNKVKTRTGAEYEKLKELIPDIDQRKLVSQMQFCLPGFLPPCNAKGEFFIADQVWIKYDNRGRIQDMVVVDAKLSEGTALTSGQTAAKNQTGKGSLAFKPQKAKTVDETTSLDLPDEINQGTLIEIKSFYKLFGDGNDTFKSVKKLN